MSATHICQVLVLNGSPRPNEISHRYIKINDDYSGPQIEVY